MKARTAGLQIIFHRRLSELVIAGGMDYPVIYFDRDGVLNRFTRGKYVNTRADVVPMPTAAATLQAALRLTPFVFVVSNQAGVHHRFMTPSDLDAVDARLWELLACNPLASLYCTHDPEAGCPCRKPRTGMIDTARDLVRALGVRIGAEVMLGDNVTDEKTATAAGVDFVLVSDGPGVAFAPWLASLQRAEDQPEHFPQGPATAGSQRER